MHGASFNIANERQMTQYFPFYLSELLYSLTKWTIDNRERFRSKDLVSFFETLAILNHETPLIDEFKTKLLPRMVRDDFSATDWLSFVWSLSALGLVEHSHLSSVLSYVVV